MAFPIIALQLQHDSSAGALRTGSGRHAIHAKLQSKGSREDYPGSFARLAPPWGRAARPTTHVPHFSVKAMAEAYQETLSWRRSSGLAREKTRSKRKCRSRMSNSDETCGFSTPISSICTDARSATRRRSGPSSRSRAGAAIGAQCKISSHTFICEGVTLEDGVFVGHGVMFTNESIRGDVCERQAADGRGLDMVADAGEARGPRSAATPPSWPASRSARARSSAPARS